MTAEVFRNLGTVLAGIDRAGVVHVGAHRGQEVARYRTAGFDRIVLVEPNQRHWPHLDQLGVTVIRSACGQRGTGLLNITAADQRASLLTPVDYPVRTTVPVDVVPLSDLQAGCNVAVIDVQGSELDVLGSGDLDRLDAVIVEVTDDSRYHGAATADGIHEFFTRIGWSRTGDYRGGHTVGIADAVWRRR